MADSTNVISDFQFIAGSVIFASLAVILFVLFNRKSSQSEPETQNGDNESVQKQQLQQNQQESGGGKTSGGNGKKNKKAGHDKQKKEQKAAYGHRWLLTTLKGHSGTVLNLDFSGNGKYLASCADDRSVLIWYYKTIPTKENKSTRANVEYDYATQIKWSPDCKAFIISQASGNAIQVYKIARKDDNNFGKAEPILTFPQKHKQDIVNIGIACTGRFIMSCSPDTSIVVWNLKGDILTTIDTHQVTNYHATVSPCGRFVASSGFSPDVKVWEICFSKTGEFTEAKRAFDLKGHSSGVYSFAFNSNSTRMASVSKDGTWKLWDTDIDYAKGQETYLVLTGQFKTTFSNVHLDLSPDGRTIAISAGSDVTIISGVSGEVQEKLVEVHTEPITALCFSPNGKHLLVAGGKHIRVFHNVLGYKNAISDLEIRIKLMASNSTMRSRLQSQLDDTKTTLDSVLKELDQ